MGYEFDQISPNIDEKAIRFEDPQELTTALAKAKAEALKSKISGPAILVTSDQVVVWQGEIREKPESEKEAREFLLGYNLYPAKTVTAVIVTNTETGKQVEAIDIAKIHFNPFTEEEIKEIIKDGLVFDLAGAFTVSGELWEKHIKNIEGTRDSVMGLPKDVVKRLISEVVV